MRAWRGCVGLAACLMTAALAPSAQAQTPLNPALPPADFHTTIRVRLYCGSPDCPEQVYDTVWATNPLGDVYAQDSGILYPFNKELPIHQFPITLRQYAVPGSTITGTAGSFFRDNVLTLYYEMEASELRANFKMRMRFHPYEQRCEILTWEYWGRSGGFPLERAYVGGECRVGPAVAAAAKKDRRPARLITK